MFQGVMTALVTPFRGGRVDEAALAKLIEAQIAAGVDGLVPCGTTGESATLSIEEHVEVVRLVVQAVRKRIPVIAGAGANSTLEARELAAACKTVGADGLLQVTPYYNRPTQDGLVSHFKAVLEAAPLPTVLYNVPSRTGCDLLPETVARLAELPGIVGIKEATGNPVRAAQILARVGERLAVYSGDDLTALPLYAVGARGVISVTSNVAPAEVVAVWRAARENDFATARELNARLFPLHELLFVETNPIPVKAALAMMGLMDAEIRPPLYPLAGKSREALRAQLATMGLL